MSHGAICQKCQCYLPPPVDKWSCKCETAKRESIDEVLEIVGTYGPWGTDINESLRYQIVLADEVKRLRAHHEANSQWQPIATAPISKTILMWWIPIDDNKYAEAAVIGQLSATEKGMWWNGQRAEYETLDRITHWMPLPTQPRDRYVNSPGQDKP